MAGMDQGIMALTAMIGMPGAPIGGHTIPTMWIEFTEEHRWLPMSPPLLEFLTRNRNLMSPSPQLQGSTGNSAMDFDEGDGRLAKLPTNPNAKFF